MQEIGELCKKYNVVCVADEVYEMNVFPEYEHVRMASLPGMWERTITIGSSGKAFRCSDHTHFMKCVDVVFFL